MESEYMKIKKEPISMRNKKIQKYLTRPEQNAIDKLKSILERLYPGVKFKIFGSKATGKYDEESDVDILILLPCEVDEKIREQVIDIIFDIDLEFDTNISPLILSQKEWRNLRPLPIFYFVEKEGVLL
jgi:predicted nucleotidyltransferase